MQDAVVPKLEKVVDLPFVSSRSLSPQEPSGIESHSLLAERQASSPACIEPMRGIAGTVYRVLLST